jgi:hypothetical protein
MTSTLVSDTTACEHLTIDVTASSSGSARVGDLLAPMPYDLTPIAEGDEAWDECIESMHTIKINAQRQLCSTVGLLLLALLAAACILALLHTASPSAASAPEFGTENGGASVHDAGDDFDNSLLTTSVDTAVLVVRAATARLTHLQTAIGAYAHQLSESHDMANNAR